MLTLKNTRIIVASSIVGGDIMIVTVDNFEKYLGQKVRDPYGRIVGKIVSFYSDVSGVVSQVEVEFKEDSFETIPISRIEITKDGIILLPEWKAEALDLIRQLERARKRALALEELYSKGDIPRHAYDEFKKKLERDLSRLHEKSKEVKEMLNKRMASLEAMILHLEKALTALRISYIAGEIGERSFKSAFEPLRNAREKAIEEKDDIKRVLEKIKKLEAEPIEIRKEVPARKPETEKKVEVPTEHAEPIVVQVVGG